MFQRIARFELRYQLRNPVFWVSAVIFFLLTFGAATSDKVHIGSGGNVHLNAPVAVVQTCLILSLFFMFVTTAFVANVIVRDDESGFGPLIRSTRVSRFSYLFGRFTGAFVAAALAFMVVPAAIWLGSLMPWVDPETLGPNNLAVYATAYAFYALPGIFLVSALFFAVATMTRSMMYTYVAVVLFLALYIALNGLMATHPEWLTIGSYGDPFGIVAFGDATRYYTAFDSNTHIPPIAGPILVNRLIWLGVSLAMLALAYWRFSFSQKAISQRKARRLAKRQAKLARSQPQLVEQLPPLTPERAGWARLVARTRFEMGQVFRSPAFFVLLFIGLINSFAGLYFSNEIYGTPARPLTFSLIQPLIGSFSIIPVIIAIYYGGELVWRDRDRKMHEIVDATSVPGWSYMVPKTIAVSLVLLATLVISVIGAMGVQLLRGYTHFELDKFAAWYVAPLAVKLVMIAVLSVFVQALSPNKYVGWGVMVLYIVATIVLGSLGFQHPLYLYGATGANPLSDMNGAHVGLARGWWLRLYWGGWALALAVLAHLLWRRGADAALMPRLRQLPRRLRSPAGGLLVAALLVAGGTGGWLYDRMDVVNHYVTSDQQDAQTAAYEKKYLKYQFLPQPTATKVTMDIAIYPNQHRMVTQGRVAFVNNTKAPIYAIHLRLDTNPDLEWVSQAVPGTTLAMDDKVNKYRIYRFDKPLAPGATGYFTFTTRIRQRGIKATGVDTSLVRNGTFLNNSQFAPMIGMDRSGLLQDPTKRRKYGLPADLRPPKLADQSARQRNYIGNAPWVMSDITVSTVAGQTPMAPGEKVSDVTADGRRTARFVSTKPILAFFSVQSARYAVATRQHGNIKLQVYYDPAHAFNVQRMLDAMGTSLDYYQANFDPYQFNYERILEFPGYQVFAQSFAGTIPYSERIGFIADVGGPADIDYVTYVTAHETAHQWWAHQLIGSDQQGSTMLSETLAQYSALMVMKHLYGPDQIRRFLKYELDMYLAARGSEDVEELPLDKVENQPYIHYRKGSVVMYLLQDRLGEKRVNHMLAGLLAKYRFKGPPYANATDLVDGFMSLTRNDRERKLVTDLLEKITIYDLKTVDAHVRKLPDGRYETTLDVKAAKFHADGKGKETVAPLDDIIDIGLFTAKPGSGTFSHANVIQLQRHPIKSGEQQLRIVTTRKPNYAGIDPYNEYIDRNSDDNIVAVE